MLRRSVLCGDRGDRGVVRGDREKGMAELLYCIGMACVVGGWFMGGISEIGVITSIVQGEARLASPRSDVHEIKSTSPHYSDLPIHPSMHPS